MAALWRVNLTDNTNNNKRPYKTVITFRNVYIQKPRIPRTSCSCTDLNWILMLNTYSSTFPHMKKHPSVKYMHILSLIVGKEIRGWIRQSQGCTKSIVFFFQSPWKYYILIQYRITEHGCSLHDCSGNNLRISGIWTTSIAIMHFTLWTFYFGHLSIQAFPGPHTLQYQWNFIWEETPMDCVRHVSVWTKWTIVGWNLVKKKKTLRKKNQENKICFKMLKSEGVYKAVQIYTRCVKFESDSNTYIIFKISKYKTGQKRKDELFSVS